MKALCATKGLLTLWPVMLAVALIPDRVVARHFDDPEDSPLYRHSVQKILAEMAARDTAQAAARRGVAGPIIVLEGAKWYYGFDAEAKELGPGSSSRAGGGGPIPLDVTVSDFTCGITCGTSCYGTCSGGSCVATCKPVITMCVYSTCVAPNPTCSSSQPTCFGVSCNQPGPTCAGYLTCYEATCVNTCSPATCPTTIGNVTVPRPGQIQMSFYAVSYLTYTLQYCTNLAALQWNNVNTVTGANTVISVSHTNPAPRAFYRVWVQHM